MTVTQGRVEELLLRVHLWTIKTSLHESCMTSTQKVVKFHLESESKMCNSQNDIIMRLDYQ